MIYEESKNRIAKQIVPILQKCIDDNNIQTYIEPFVGGANIIDKISCKRKIGYDINKYLIALLNHARDNYQKKDCFPSWIDREYYVNVRNSFKNNEDKFSDLEKGIVRFLCYESGIFFGRYITSFTKDNYIDMDYYQDRKNILLKQAINLQGIEFHVQDYKELSTDLKDALIYCDIPYGDTRQYKVGGLNHNEFWDWARRMSLDNFVFISAEYAPDDFVAVWRNEAEAINTNGVTFKYREKERLFIYKNGLSYIKWRCIYEFTFSSKLS